MAATTIVDWTRFDAGTRRALVQRLRPGEAAAIARGFVWATQPIDVLGAITARPDCSLGTALTVFIRGEPERFEQLEPDEPQPAERRALRFLLRLHATINAGAHRFDPRELPEDPARIARLVIPRRDRLPGRAVWGLDPAVVGPALDLAAARLAAAPTLRPEPPAAARAPRWRGGLGGVLGRLGRARRPF